MEINVPLSTRTDVGDVAAVERRPISEIMYTDDELDVVFLQPTLYQRHFYDEQNEVFLRYQEVVEGHAAAMNDLGTEPNHGVLQLAAILREHGLRVDVLDFHALDIVFRRDRRLVEEGDIWEILARKRARVYGISSKVVAAKSAMKLAAIVKELHPDSTVVMGGVHPTFQAPVILRECSEVDYVFRGEADHSIVPFWEWLNGSGDLADINGISYRGDDGEIVSIEKDLTAIDLDEIPYPAYDLVAREVQPLVPRILTARGCVLRCVFCSSAALFGYRFNSREAIRVVDQIEYSMKRYGLEFVCMGDLTFMAHKETGVAICEEIIRRGLDVKWSTQTTIGRIDRDAAELMQRSGCVQIGFGVETGSQLLIDEANKRIEIQRAADQFKIVKDAGMSVQTYWVFGLPGETFESAMLTVDVMREFIRDELTDAIHVTTATPYPGTPLFENPAAYGIRIVDYDFDNYMTNGGSLGIGRPVIETSELTRDHLFMFWQLALATATEEFGKRFENSDERIHYIPTGMYTSGLSRPAGDESPRAEDLKPEQKAATRTMLEIKRSRRILQFGEDVERAVATISDPRES